jgi:hypothetical protein
MSGAVSIQSSYVITGDLPKSQAVIKKLTAETQSTQRKTKAAGETTNFTEIFRRLSAQSGVQ